MFPPESDIGNRGDPSGTVRSKVDTWEALSVIALPLTVPGGLGRVFRFQRHRITGAIIGCHAEEACVRT